MLLNGPGRPCCLGRRRRCALCVCANGLRRLPSAGLPARNTDMLGLPSGLLVLVQVTPALALLDTGTPTLQLPAAIVDAYVQAVAAAVHASSSLVLRSVSSISVRLCMPSRHMLWTVAGKMGHGPCLPQCQSSWQRWHECLWTQCNTILAGIGESCRCRCFFLASLQVYVADALLVSVWRRPTLSGSLPFTTAPMISPQP